MSSYLWIGPKCVGVFVHVAVDGDRVYYIRYRHDDKLIEEKAGRAAAGMTPAKAAHIRLAKINGKVPTNRERREEKKRPAVEKCTIEAIGGFLNDLKAQINNLEKIYSEHIEKLHKNFN